MLTHTKKMERSFDLVDCYPYLGQLITQNLYGDVITLIKLQPFLNTKFCLLTLPFSLLFYVLIKFFKSFPLFFSNIFSAVHCSVNESVILLSQLYLIGLFYHNLWSSWYLYIWIHIIYKNLKFSVFPQILVKSTIRALV